MRTRETKVVDAEREKESPFVTLNVLLISADLGVWDPHWNLGVKGKSKMRIENKRHTSAHQPLASLSTT
jgi:hypothetical protein